MNNGILHEDFLGGVLGLSVLVTGETKKNFSLQPDRQEFRI